MVCCGLGVLRGVNVDCEVGAGVYCCLGLFWSWRLRDASAWIMISMFSGVSCSDIVPLSKVSFIQPCEAVSERGFVIERSCAFGWSSEY